MDMKRAKEILGGVINGTAIKHPKVLIGELCVVVNFLLEEIDKIKTPIVSVLSKKFPDIQPPWPDQPNPDRQIGEDQPNPMKRIGEDKPIPKRRMGNAGDAE